MYTGEHERCVLSKNTIEQHIQNLLSSDEQRIKESLNFYVYIVDYLELSQQKKEKEKLNQMDSQQCIDYLLNQFLGFNDKLEEEKQATEASLRQETQRDSEEPIEMIIARLKLEVKNLERKQTEVKLEEKKGTSIKNGRNKTKNRKLLSTDFIF